MIFNEGFFAEPVEGNTGTTVFRDESDSGVIGIQSPDLSEEHPDITIDKALLWDITDRYVEDMAKYNLIDKNEITVDPLADEGQRPAYELRFQDSPENDTLMIITFTYLNAYLNRFFFICPSDYSDALLPAYNQFMESIRFR